MRTKIPLVFVLCFAQAAFAENEEPINYPHMSLSPVLMATSEDASAVFSTGWAADSSDNTGCRHVVARSWAVETAQELNRVCHDVGFGFATAFAVSPKGDWVAVGNQKGQMLFLDMASGDALAFDRAHKTSNGEGILGLSFSPNAEMVVSTGADGVARGWDARTGALLFTSQSKGGKAAGVAHAPDGSMFATVHADGQARIWTAATGEPHVLANGNPAVLNHWPGVAGHSRSLLSVGFSPSGDRLITGGGDRKAKVWDVTTGEMIVEIDQPDTVVSVAFSADGRFILVAAARTVAILRADGFDAVETFEFEKSLRNAVFSADSGKLFIGTHGGGAFGLDLSGLE